MQEGRLVHGRHRPPQYIGLSVPMQATNRITVLFRVVYACMQRELVYVLNDFAQLTCIASSASVVVACCVGET